MRMIQLLGWVSIGLLFSCNPQDEPPRYIHISDQILETTQEQGEAGHNFMDAWVFVNGSSIGHYELPRTIPVFYQGDQALISVQAGVRENGMLSTPSSYPFTSNFEIEMSSPAFQIDTIVPSYTYHDNAQIILIEGFEANHFFTFDADGVDSTNLIITDEESVSGANSGLLEVGEEEMIEVASSLNYADLPLNNTPIYVEFDYKSDIELAIGLLGYNNGQELKAYFSLANPSDTWQRIYVDISPLVLEGQLDSYRLMFQVNSKGLAATSGKVYLDNIKWIHVN